VKLAETRLSEALKTPVETLARRKMPRNVGLAGVTVMLARLV